MLSLPQSCFGRASGRGRRLKRRRGAGKPRAASTRRFREDAGIVTRRRGRCRAGDRRSAGAGTAVSGKGQGGNRDEIGRAHVGTPVTNAHIVCRLLLEKKKNSTTIKTQATVP